MRKVWHLTSGLNGNLVFDIGFASCFGLYSRFAMPEKTVVDLMVPFRRSEFVELCSESAETMYVLQLLATKDGTCMYSVLYIQNLSGMAG